ncbi:alpha/beta hydrolase [Bacillus sp. FJAT-27251]|uniref:alpha/beta hydrolase n=1 Tax=Bacillus sp. FJAT-27251 TaxID=1684142 RepID=UPI0006A79E35|nr:alpha/beta hydrolase [Bacillus sp. FJAT-27251]
MSGQSFYFKGIDGKKIYGVKWVAEEKPRALLQIAHGMAEHIGRYSEFADILVSRGVHVYGNDHRGHGHTATSEEDRGYYGDENGFETVVHDMKELTGIMQEDYPDIPVFLLGHSMGSFLSRRYIQLYGEELAGVIFTGTGGHPGLLGKVGHYLSAREARKQGRRTPSRLMNALTFGSYNKAFKPNKTEFDWLSRDEREVEKYIQDPLCGGIFTAGFFEDFLKGLLSVYDEDDSIPRQLPAFFLSGDKDPVGKNARGVLQSSEKLRSAGLIDVSCKFYPGARHEILNETNKEEVYDDILEWIASRASSTE